MAVVTFLLAPALAVVDLAFVGFVAEEEEERWSSGDTKPPLAVRRIPPLPPSSAAAGDVRPSDEGISSMSSAIPIRESIVSRDRQQWKVKHTPIRNAMHVSCRCCHGDVYGALFPLHTGIR